MILCRLRETDPANSLVSFRPGPGLVRVEARDDAMAHLKGLIVPSVRIKRYSTPQLIEEVQQEYDMGL